MILEEVKTKDKGVLAYKNSRNEESFVKVYNQDGSNEIYIHAIMLKPEEIPDFKRILESIAQEAEYLNSLQSKSEGRR